MRLGEETDDRKKNDQYLHDLIDNCCTNASEGLEKLNDALDQEIKDRELADDAQQKPESITSRLILVTRTIESIKRSKTASTVMNSCRRISTKRRLSAKQLMTL